MAETSMKCNTKNRYKLIANSQLSGNGIDYIEVVVSDSASCLKCRPYLVVYFFKDLDDKVTLDKENVRIEGGARVRNIGVEWAKCFDEVPDEVKPKLLVQENEPNDGTKSTKNVFVIYPTSDGDFSTYTLRIVDSARSVDPPEGFDLMLSSIDFSFKIDCPSNFDCKPQQPYPQEILNEPAIDYLSKDYASFRRLILDRLAMVMPTWKERNPADFGVMMAELLAYQGDLLSYYQDAVATEAYLGTARSRISVKRHARLLDYFMHSGCNSRVWVCIKAENNNGCVLAAKTKLLTGVGNGNLVVKEEDLPEELAMGIKVFETINNIELYEANNKIYFYSWGDLKCCLPKGATSATLIDYAERDSRHLNLKEGDVLVFEEICDPNGSVDNKNTFHRCAVRLTKLESCVDYIKPAEPVHLLKIEWGLEDALNFPLCIGDAKLPVAIAHGNVVLADHGLSIPEERLEDFQGGQNFRPSLLHKSLTFKGPAFKGSDSASSVFNYDLQDVTADIFIAEPKAPPKNEFEKIEDWLPETWRPQKDLLSSNKFDLHFVVETENDGAAIIRFGDNVHGMNPKESREKNPDFLYAFYRVGNGSEGNVGAESIKRVVNSKSGVPNLMIFPGVKINESNPVVYNPLPAKGGTDPESNAEVCQNASQTAKINLRAIAEADYAEMIKQKCSEVQRAIARTRWTGSWYTIYVTIDRYGGKPIDKDFKEKVKGILDKYRLCGCDVEVSDPLYVPLEIVATVNVSQSSLRDEVERSLLETFSSRTMPDGRKGFFHPDNFTFGQPVFLSKICAIGAKIDGVISFSVDVFKRTDKKDRSGIEEGVIKIGPYEIFQLENDSNYPERGRITFNMIGGR
jgi:hypothetical protein